MFLEPVGVWLWEKYGKEIVDKTLGALKKEWETFQWDRAVTNYHGRMKELYSTMRVLGKPEPVSLEGIFTDVYILGRPTALRRFGIEQLKKAHEENRSLSGENKRLKGLQLAKEKERLFVLGKPGAGKTTFLKYLTLQALDNKIERVPIFLSLHDWANSGLELMPFVVRQFEICAFPDSKAFIEHLLDKGWAMVLFDGLDEVNAEGDRRARLTTAINDFIKQYPQNKYLITCRIAASDYAFDGFADVEIADFDSEQVKTFASKWFSDSQPKGERFLVELHKPGHHGLRELAQTPLLLALLCLAFEDTLTFPPRRNEIYEEALEALLKKWDASRNIQRDEVYKALSLGRKRQLFARIAAEYFEKGEIFFRQDDLAQRVESFMAKLPVADIAYAPDADVIIKAVESQHGVFVERAHYIYSFSHLTLQEYFTARYIVDNAADGTLERAVDYHLTNDRWCEVFLLVASMLPEAGVFFKHFRRAVDRLIVGEVHLTALIKWAAVKAETDYQAVGHSAVARANARAIAEIAFLDLPFARIFANILALDRDRDLAHVVALDRDLAHALAGALDLDPDLYLELARDRSFAIALVLARDRNRALDIALALVLAFARFVAHEHGFYEIVVREFAAALRTVEEMGLADLNRALQNLTVPPRNASDTQWQSFATTSQEIIISHRNIGRDWHLTDKQRARLNQYDKATLLLAECLRLAAVSDRRAIEHSLLLPPGEWSLG